MLPSKDIIISFSQMLDAWLHPSYCRSCYKSIRMLVVLIIDVTHLLFLQVLYDSRALSQNTLQLLDPSQASGIKNTSLQKLSSEIQIRSYQQQQKGVVSLRRASRCS